MLLSKLLNWIRSSLHWTKIYKYLHIPPQKKWFSRVTLSMVCIIYSRQSQLQLLGQSRWFRALPGRAEDVPIDICAKFPLYKYKSFILTSISLYTLTYSQIVGVGKRSRTHVGAGSRSERQQNSPAASRTYSDGVLRSGILKAGLRYLLLLTGITNRIPVRGGRARSVRIVKTVKKPQSS